MSWLYSPLAATANLSSGIIGAGDVASGEAFGDSFVGYAGITGVGEVASGESVDVAGISASLLIESGVASGEAADVSRVGPRAKIVIDHTSVAKYADIPQAYKDLIKQRRFTYPGESHSHAPIAGLGFLEALDPSFAVSTIYDGGTPESPTSSNLRADRLTWGDLDHTSGWYYSCGEEDFFTSATALSRIKAWLLYCKNTGPALDYTGFGWCWDQARGAFSATADPVYGCRWAGYSVGGPEGNLPWGLDDADTSITGNSINLDTYLEAMEELLSYCESEGIDTSVFFTTGPMDNYNGEQGYQRQLKQDRIRDHVDVFGGILFDDGDILAWDNAGSENVLTWDGHNYQFIAPDNLLQFDGSDGEDVTGYHIGERGALRLAKAVWVMLAMAEGWDGVPEGGIVGVGEVASGESIGDATLSATIVSTGFESGEAFDIIGVGGIRGVGEVASEEGFEVSWVSATITTTAMESGESFDVSRVGTSADVFGRVTITVTERHPGIAVVERHPGITATEE